MSYNVDTKRVSTQFSVLPGKSKSQSQAERLGDDIGKNGEVLARKPSPFLFPNFSADPEEMLSNTESRSNNDFFHISHRVAFVSNISSGKVTAKPQNKKRKNEKERKKNG